MGAFSRLFLGDCFLLGVMDRRLRLSNVGVVTELKRSAEGDDDRMLRRRGDPFPVIVVESTDIPRDSDIGDTGMFTIAIKLLI